MSVGTHVVLECYGCDSELINNEDFIRSSMLEAAMISGCSIINSVFHSFPVQGVSGIVLIEESHLSIHTWPELSYAAVDVFTCGSRVDAFKIKEFLLEKFCSKDFDHFEIIRGSRIIDFHH